MIHSHLLRFFTVCCQTAAVTSTSLLPLCYGAVSRKSAGVEHRSSFWLWKRLSHGYNWWHTSLQHDHGNYSLIAHSFAHLLPLITLITGIIILQKSIINCHLRVRHQSQQWELKTEKGRSWCFWKTIRRFGREAVVSFLQRKTMKGLAIDCTESSDNVPAIFKCP